MSGRLEPPGTLYCQCARPVIDVDHDAGCRRCGLPVDFSPAAPNLAPLELVDLGGRPKLTDPRPGFH